MKLVQFFKKDSRPLKAANGRASNKTFNEALQYHAVSYHCMRGSKNLKHRGIGKKEIGYVCLSVCLQETLDKSVSLSNFLNSQPNEIALLSTQS